MYYSVQFQIMSVGKFLFAYSTLHLGVSAAFVQFQIMYARELLVTYSTFVNLAEVPFHMMFLPKFLGT
jgi:hypothetical protein